MNIPFIDLQLTAIEECVRLIREELYKPDIPVINVPAGGDLQDALNRAPNGAQIKLAPAAVYAGSFVLPPNSGDKYTTIMTDIQLPDGRIDPTVPLALIKSDGASPSAIRATATHHYAFQGVGFGANVNGDGDIIRFGMGTETSPNDIPHHFIVDRCVLRGDSVIGQKRAVAMNGGDITIINSDIRDIFRNGQDNQTLGGWNTPGRHIIRNNRLESGGENILYGGAKSPAGFSAAEDILIEDNDITRPLAWKTDGVNRTVKNLLELKCGRRVVIRKNRMSNHWPAAQSGWAIVFTPRNNNTLEDVTFEDNEVTNVSMGINVSGSAYEGTNAYVPPFKKLYVRNNLFVVNKAQMGGTGWFLQIGGIETDDSSDYQFENNTIIHDGNNLVAIYQGTYDDPSGVSQVGKPLRGFVYRRNLSRTGIYGFWTESAYGGLWGAVPDGVITDNVLAGSRQQALLAGRNNVFPTEAEFQAAFVDYANGDYTLKPGMYPGIGRQ